MITRRWSLSGALSNKSWFTVSSLPHELKPGWCCLNGSNSFTTVGGSTAPSVLNPLWTLKLNSTKYMPARLLALSTKSGQPQKLQASPPQGLRRTGKLRHPEKLQNPSSNHTIHKICIVEVFGIAAAHRAAVR